MLNADTIVGNLITALEMFNDLGPAAQTAAAQASARLFPGRLVAGLETALHSVVLAVPTKPYKLRRDGTIEQDDAQ